MLGPISHLQIWDGEWGAHAEVLVDGKGVADLVALPEVGSTGREIVESFYSRASQKELPDNFQLVVRALDKSMRIKDILGVGYGDNPSEKLCWQTTGRYEIRKVSDVRGAIPDDIDRVRTMSWGTGQAVWLEFNRDGTKKSLVFGPHWGGVEVLEVVTQYPAKPRDWVQERLGAMDSMVYCVLETRR